MCGIVSVASLKGYPVNKLVRQQFEAQKHRGVEGFGVFDYQEKNLIRSTTERGIKKWLKRHPSTNLLFHHRFPTSTENVKNACHPFSTKDFFRTNYVLVHNGHISNDKVLKAEHEKLGIVYHSVQPDGRFNDSEALLWDLALYLEGKQDRLKAEGGIAFVCLAIGKGNKHDRLYFGRNYNPLKMELNEHVLMLSSEGKGEDVTPHTLYNYNYVNNQLSTKPLDIDRWVYTQPTSDPARVGEILEDYEAVGQPSAKHGLSLIRTIKTDPIERAQEVAQVVDRMMWRNEGWYYDCEVELGFDYDCLTLLYYQWQKLRYSLVGVSYTMALYEDALDLLEDRQQGDEYRDLAYAWGEEELQLIEGETA